MFVFDERLNAVNVSSWIAPGEGHPEEITKRLARKLAVVSQHNQRKTIDATSGAEMLAKGTESLRISGRIGLGRRCLDGQSHEGAATTAIDRRGHPALKST